MKTTLLLTTLVIGFCQLAFAETKSYNIEKQKFSIDLPKDWFAIENFMGTPLTVFGPEVEEGESRTVVLISPTGQEDVKHVYNSKAFKKNAANYKKEREDWLKGNFGESISYETAKEESWNGVEKSYQFGYRYELPTGKFFEKSAYVLCGGNKLFYVKALIPEAYDPTLNRKPASVDADNHTAIFERTLKSLKCEK